MTIQNHEDYFADHPIEVRKRLEEIQRMVEAQIPGAARTISYKVPAFKKERVFFYFAAFKNHIGIYPPVTEDTAVIAETQAYRGLKGNLSFLHSEELPMRLIGRVISALEKQYSSKRN